MTKVNLIAAVLFVILSTVMPPVEGGYINICDSKIGRGANAAEVVSVNIPHFNPKLNHGFAIFLFDINNNYTFKDFTKLVLSQYLYGTLLQKEIVSIENSNTSTSTMRYKYVIPENIEHFIWEVILRN